MNYSDELCIQLMFGGWRDLLGTFLKKRAGLVQNLCDGQAFTFSAPELPATLEPLLERTPGP